MSDLGRATLFTSRHACREVRQWIIRNIHMEESMSKRAKRNRKAQRETVGRRKHSKLWPIGIVALAAGLVIAVVFFFPKSEPWGLPASPRSPRPATLSPELFSGRVAQVYRIAKEAPELVEQMPCYCGCYVNPGHQNNLDCYTDRHSVG